MSGVSYPVSPSSYPSGSRLPDVLARWEPPAGCFARWGAQESALADLDLAALRSVLLARDTTYADRDALLAALLRVARDDADAATVVVVCLLPGLRRMLRRLAVGVDRADVDAELVAQTYARVVGYDLDRRPVRIASNLLLDALGRTLTWLRREGAWRSATVPLDGAALPAAPAPDLPDLLRVAVEAGVVSASDAELVRATRLDDVSLADSAATAGLTYDGAGKRRQRAEAALRCWWRRECAAPKESGQTCKDRPASACGC